MKKIFTLFVAFLALTFCAKAQVTIILEAHNVWQDGTGYQLLLDADHNTYGTVIPTSGGLTESGDAPASVYAEFEYKVPVNADGSLSTQNIVQDGSATITIPAGTYDFCITNPTPGDRMWIAGGGIDPTRADDYVFVDGSTYHFLMVMNGSNDACQLTVTVNPTSPTIIPSTNVVNFGNVNLGSTASAMVTVNNYLLTAPVTAVTAAPFEISADGTTFGTTATVPTAGGDLYVRYTPTAIGTDNGTITLSSTGATDATITLTGAAFDCSNFSVPFTEGFESSIDCWQMISADPANDMEFGIYADANAYEGIYDFRFSSYYNATDYNQWLITPELTLNASETYLVKFFYKAYNSADTFKVMYSTTNNTPSSFSVLADYSTVNSTWTEVTHQLPAGTKYVAIKYNGYYKYYLYVDNFSILTAAPAMSLSTNALDFGAIGSGNTTASQAVTLSTINVNEAITLTATAPFEISLDDNTFAATQTIPANPDMLDNTTFYVRFAPSTAGTFNQNLIVSSTSFNDTITLTGEAVSCGIATLPYTTYFDNDASNLCWEIIDANNDGKTFSFSSPDSLVYYAYSTSNDADDWLISPVFTLTGAQFGYFDYTAYHSSYPERFQVFAIDANNNQTALTGAIDVTTVGFQTQVLDLTPFTGNYRIGIHCISDADEYYFLVTNFSVNNNVPASNVELSTDALEFSVTPVGSVSAPKQVVLSTTNVNEAFTLTTAAPFEISLNGTTFATTLTIPANAAMLTNDTIYVRFAPTAAGQFSQNLTFVSTNHNASVALTGSGADCSGGISTFPFVENFNNGIYPPTCWGYEDANNYTIVYHDQETEDLMIGMIGLDMLVTPEIHSTTPLSISFGYRNYLGDYATSPTTFRVGYSSTGTNASDFTWFNTVSVPFEFPEEFFYFNADVPANTKYVAINVLELGVYSTYTDKLWIDNFTLFNDATIMADPENISFGSILIGSPAPVKEATITGALLTNDIAVSAPANFEVSANGASFASTATIPAAGGTLYVRYNPTAAGSHNGTITLTSGSANKTITVSGSALDCSVPATLPFFEGFDGDEFTCWTILDQDGDGDTWANITMTPYEGDGCVTSSSYNGEPLTPDNWLISPALAIPSQGATLSFYVCAQDASYAAEHYGVYVSTSGVAPSDFTLLYEEDLDPDGGNHRVQGAWKQKTVNLPYGGQNIHIAIRHFNVTDMFRMNVDNFSVTAGTGVENHGVKTIIFPNPANNVLNINASANIDRVEIFNMMGQLVGSYDANDMNTQINTSSFANGVYTVKINTENGTSTQKFTVAR